MDDQTKCLGLSICRGGCDGCQANERHINIGSDEIKPYPTIEDMTKDVAMWQAETMTNHFQVSKLGLETIATMHGLIHKDGETVYEFKQRLCDKTRSMGLCIQDHQEPNPPKKEELPLGVTLRQITETIARNCVAWDTSKDKTKGLLPEVYLTDIGLYKRLTGEEYTYMGACRKFNIGDE